MELRILSCVVSSGLGVSVGLAEHVGVGVIIVVGVGLGVEGIEVVAGENVCRGEGVDVWGAFW